MDNIKQRALHFLYDLERKNSISLTNANDRRMKRPDCCAICEEIRNLENKGEILRYLIEKELNSDG